MIIIINRENNSYEEYECPIEFIPNDNTIVVNNTYFREIENKHVPGIRYKSFYISMNGEIYNILTHRISKGAFGPDHRYCVVELMKGDNTRVSILLHRLLMIVYMYYRPDFNELEVNHIDGNKRNNSLYNLEWVTHSQNMKHALDHHLIASGEDHMFATTSEEIVRKICKDLQNTKRTKNLYTDLAEKYGVTPIVVLQIDHGISWTRVSQNYNIDHNLRVYAKRFTQEDVHFMCQYFQDHKDENIDDMLPILCDHCGIINDHNNRTRIKRIYYKFPGYFDYITSKYDY